MSKHQLYFSPQPTRSARARWAFLEAGVPFEGHTVDVFKGEQKSENYLKVNPLGLVPAAVIESEPIIESSALALIAASSSFRVQLCSQRWGCSDWRRALQWVVFAPAELDHWLVLLNEERLFKPPEARNAEVKTRALAELTKRPEPAIRSPGRVAVPSGRLVFGR